MYYDYNYGKIMMTGLRSEQLVALLGWSSEETAAKADMTRQTVHRLEKALMMCRQVALSPCWNSSVSSRRRASSSSAARVRAPA